MPHSVSVPWDQIRMPSPYHGSPMGLIEVPPMETLKSLQLVLKHSSHGWDHFKSYRYPSARVHINIQYSRKSGGEFNLVDWRMMGRTAKKNPLTKRRIMHIVPNGLVMRSPNVVHDQSSYETNNNSFTESTFARHYTHEGTFRRKERSARGKHRREGGP